MKYRTFAFTDKIYNLLSQKSLGVEVDTAEIKSLLESDRPCMISRFGSNELQALSYIRYYPVSIFLKKRILFYIQYGAGFFPASYENLKHFYNLYKEDVKEIDLLVSWRIEELLFKDWIGKKCQIKKTTLDNFYEHKHPWTSVLKDKHILVIHPFAETIANQYTNYRLSLFRNSEVLPEFASLQTIKAVQSIAANPVNFDSWFDALDWMKQEVSKCDFDIALIGCGAYGLPLAAHIKKIGKKAIHMGGILQFLFGIKCVRYEENPIISKYINKYFVYPKEADKPKNASLVEGGCYWGK